MVAERQPARLRPRCTSMYFILEMPVSHDGQFYFSTTKSKTNKRKQNNSVLLLSMHTTAVCDTGKGT